MTNPIRRLQLYLCYASVDKTTARQLYQQLEKAGIEVWFDEEDLLPGSNREHEITKAIKRVDVILVCLSKKGLATAGGFHREMKLALDKAKEQPEGRIAIIPLRLDDCELPFELSDLVPLDLFSPYASERLEKNLDKITQQRILDIASPIASTSNSTSSPITPKPGWRKIKTAILLSFSLISVIALYLFWITNNSSAQCSTLTSNNKVPIELIAGDKNVQPTELTDLQNDIREYYSDYISATVLLVNDPVNLKGLDCFSYEAIMTRPTSNVTPSNTNGVGQYNIDIYRKERGQWNPFDSINSPIISSNCSTVALLILTLNLAKSLNLPVPQNLDPPTLSTQNDCDAFKDVVTGYNSFYNKSPHYDDAKQQLTTALSIKPDSFQAYHILAVVYLHENDYTHALDQDNKAISIPNVPPASLHNAVLTLVEIYYWQKEYAQAEKTLSQLSNTDTFKSSQYHILSSMIQRQKKDFAKAQQELDLAKKYSTNSFHELALIDLNSALLDFDKVAICSNCNKSDWTDVISNLDKQSIKSDRPPYDYREEIWYFMALSYNQIAQHDDACKYWNYYNKTVLTKDHYLMPGENDRWFENSLNYAIIVEPTC